MKHLRSENSNTAGLSKLSHFVVGLLNTLILINFRRKPENRVWQRIPNICKTLIACQTFEAHLPPMTQGNSILHFWWNIIFGTAADNSRRAQKQSGAYFTKKCFAEKMFRKQIRMFYLFIQLYFAYTWTKMCFWHRISHTDACFSLCLNFLAVYFHTVKKSQLWKSQIFYDSVSFLSTVGECKAAEHIILLWMKEIHLNNDINLFKFSHITHIYCS